MLFLTTSGRTRPSRIYLTDFLLGLPGIAAAEVSRFQTTVEPANLRSAAAMVGFATGRRVLVTGIGVPDPELIAVIAGEPDGPRGRGEEDASKHCA